MKVALTNKNYLFNHRYFQIVKVLLIIYFIFLLRLTAFRTALLIEEYIDIINGVSDLILLIIILLLIVNGFLYSKIGFLTLTPEKIVVEKNGWHRTFELEDHHKIRIRKDRGKEFVLLLDSIVFNIELNDSELESLKNYTAIIPVFIEKPSLINKFKTFINRLGKRNRSFIDEANRM